MDLSLPDQANATSISLALISSMSRETGSIPPITVLNDHDDDGETLTSIDTETEQDPDDVAEQRKASGSRSVRAPQAKLNEHCVQRQNNPERN